MLAAAIELAPQKGFQFLTALERPKHYSYPSHNFLGSNILKHR